jgi:hypothetical protein
MRQFLIFSGLLLLPATLHAQQEEKPKYIIKIDRVRVGYRSNNEGNFKAGFWIPVYVDISAGSKGAQVKDPKAAHFLEIKSNDSEGLPVFYRIPVPTSLEPNEIRTFVGYTKPGNVDAGQNVEVLLFWDHGEYKSPRPVGGPILELSSHLYVTLGSNIADLREALAFLAQNQNPGMPPQDINFRDTAPRYIAYENDVSLLPEHWFGYQTADLMILTTDRKDFLTGLFADVNKPRLAAIAQWVRRGGRLVIPVNYQNQDLLAKVLQSPVWQPLVPVIPPANPGDVQKNAVQRLEDVEVWANTRGKPFPNQGAKAMPIALLDPGGVSAGVWDVQAKTEDGRPLIATMPYGMGNITYIAFSLDEAPFKQWAGHVEFLEKLIQKFAHPVNPHDRDFGMRGRFENGVAGTDLISGIYNELENFDVNVVPFGYVALFIILYILVVGPLDYFILKHVFHKLEWTWFTFPAVVIAVSVAAYFTAYALKGNDLKINKIDIVDFDLRTELDGKQRTARAFAYGQTYFSILSPRIQNYTVGVEPNPAFWGGKGDKLLSADQVSWLGRAEFDGFGSVGRSGSQGFFRRAYSYADEAKGIRDVPIPVWTTRAFDASWEMPLAKNPFLADLVYQTREGSAKLSGTIKNNLGVDLEDAWIFFGDHCMPIPGRLKSAANGGAPVKFTWDAQTQKDITQWVNESPREAAPRDADFRSVQGRYNPTSFIRQAMFLEKGQPVNRPRNHNMRHLDFSWRMQKDQGQAETRLREAILYAHVPFQRGLAEAITTGTSPLPTNLWLGELPEPGKTRPVLAGTLAQDTYIRVLLPVRLSLEN